MRKLVLSIIAIAVCIGLITGCHPFGDTGKISFSIVNSSNYTVNSFEVHLSTDSSIFVSTSSLVKG